MKLANDMRLNKHYYYNHWSGDMTNIVTKTHNKIKIETLYRYGNPINKTFTYESFDKYAKRKG